MNRVAMLLACASTACATPAQREGGRLLFVGDGPDWRVEVREHGITVREINGLKWIWTDSAPGVRPVPGGVRYTGTLEHPYVVAGEATENVLAYTLDIRAEGCAPTAPATLTLRREERGSPPVVQSVCGRAPSR